MPIPNTRYKMIANFSPTKMFPSCSSLYSASSDTESEWESIGFGKTRTKAGAEASIVVSLMAIFFWRLAFFWGTIAKLPTTVTVCNAPKVLYDLHCD